MAVDLAQVIPPVVRAKVDLTPSTSKLSPSVSNAIDLPTLILIKEAAGRPKDREAIAELRVLLEITEQRQS